MIEFWSELLFSVGWCFYKYWFLEALTGVITYDYDGY